MPAKPRVYFPGTLHQFYQFAAPILDPIVDVFDVPDKVYSADELAAIFREERFEGAILSAFEKVPRSVIEAAPKLRALSKYGVGIEAIDLDAATERGIPVTNCPGSNSLGVAEHTVALMFALFRHVPALDRLVRANRWNDARRLIGGDVEGSTLGLAGFGSVGKLVGRRAAAMGMQVIAYDPYQPKEAIEAEGAIKVDSLEDLVERADVVSLHMVATAETRGIFSDALLARMKPGAFLINTARSVLVDQAALVRSLESGRLGGAALDVVEPEPINLDHPLLGFDNVIITPHHAGTTVRTRERTLIQACNNLVLMLNGQLPAIGLCNPAVRERFVSR